MSWDRELRSEGSVPVSDCALRSMAVTPLLLSHMTPFQLQKEVSWDQPQGVGVRAFKSLDMNAASSATMVMERAEKNKKEKKKHFEAETMVLNLKLSLS